MRNLFVKKKTKQKNENEKEKTNCLTLFLSKENKNQETKKKRRKRPNEHSYNEIPMRTNYLFWLSFSSHHCRCSFFVSFPPRAPPLPVSRRVHVYECLRSCPALCDRPRVYIVISFFSRTYSFLFILLLV